MSNASDDTSLTVYDIMLVDNYPDNPDGTRVELTDDCYYPVIMSGKFVSADDYNLGCFYCDICENTLMPAYRNPYTLANCYFCVPPAPPQQLLSVSAITSKLHNLITNVAQLTAQVASLQNST